MDWDTESRDSIYSSLSKLGLCTCGSDSANDIVLLLLDRSDSTSSFYADSLKDGFEASHHWVEFGAKVLDNAGLLQHGTGIGFAWMTDEGRNLRKFYQEFGTDSDNWPDWATSRKV